MNREEALKKYIKLVREARRKAPKPEAHRLMNQAINISEQYKLTAKEKEQAPPASMLEIKAQLKARQKA